MSLHNVRPNAEGTYTAWTLGAGASKLVAVDPGNPVSHNDDTDYIFMASGSGAASQSFFLEIPTFTSLALSAMNAGVRSKVAFLGTAESLFAASRLNGVDGTSAQLLHSVSDTWTTFSVALPRPGGGPWQYADLFNSTLEVIVSNPTALDGDARVTSLWLIPDGVEAPDQITQAREVPSRRLWCFRRANPILVTPAPLEFLDVELGDPVAVSEYGLPLQLALGGGTKRWQRVLFRAGKTDLDLATFGITATLKGLRGQLLTWMDIGRSLKTGGITHDGIARLDVGNTRQWTRPSKAWVADPADGLHRELQHNFEKQGPEGMIFERLSQNGFFRSSFVQQLTDWTTTTSVTVEPAIDNQPLFEPGVTGWVAKITSQPAQVSGPTSPASSSYNTGARVSVSVDYREGEADTGMQVQLQRQFDNWYYNGTTWQAGTAALSVPASLVNARAMFENIIVGADTTTIKVRPVIPAVAGKTAYVLHVQIEEQRWCSETRMVNDATKDTRSQDALAISNNAGVRCLHNERGSAVFEYIPKWNPAAADSGDLIYFIDVQFDANNGRRWFYRQSTAELVYEVRRAGVAVEATKSWVPVRDEPIILGISWTSSEGELDLPPYTLSVFAAGVKGTDAVSAGGMPVEASPSTMYVGADGAGTWSADGVMRYLLLTQQVFHDGEMARGGP